MGHATGRARVPIPMSRTAKQKTNRFVHYPQPDRHRSFAVASCMHACNPAQRKQARSPGPGESRGAGWVGGWDDVVVWCVGGWFVAKGSPPFLHFGRIKEVGHYESPSQPLNYHIASWAAIDCYWTAW